jgi:hypothetical protein
MSTAKHQNGCPGGLSSTAYVTSLPSAVSVSLLVVNECLGSILKGFTDRKEALRIDPTLVLIMEATPSSPRTYVRTLIARASHGSDAQHDC